MEVMAFVPSALGAGPTEYPKIVGRRQLEWPAIYSSRELMREVKRERREIVDKLRDLPLASLQLRNFLVLLDLEAMNDHQSPPRRKRLYGLFAGAIVGFAALFVFAKSQGFLDDPALRVGVIGAVAGGLAGRIGSRRGVKGAVLGIAFGSLVMMAAIFILYR